MQYGIYLTILDIYDVALAYAVTFISGMREYFFNMTLWSFGHYFNNLVNQRMYNPLKECVLIRYQHLIMVLGIT